MTTELKQAAQQALLALEKSQPDPSNPVIGLTKQDFIDHEETIRQLRAAIQQAEAQQPATGEPAAFDPVAEGGRIVASSARKSANDDNWRKLFWELAKLLNCLPSSFVDGNEHVLKKAQELQAHAAK